mmetsp:Transcript_14124/g.20868  ORF Transcript_14124/g.20868 Transcript_14124/m.20868 type:complete len:414 (+) Transcript_14124:1-1242(+)
MTAASVAATTVEDARLSRQAELDALRKSKVAKRHAIEDSAVATVSLMDWEAKMRLFKQADRQYKSQSIRFLQEYKGNMGQLHVVTNGINAMKLSCPKQLHDYRIRGLVRDEAREETRVKKEEEEENIREEEESQLQPPTVSSSPSPDKDYYEKQRFRMGTDGTDGNRFEEEQLRKTVGWEAPLPPEQDTVVMVYHELADLEEAIENYGEVLKLRKLRLGKDHLEVASILHNMGDVYFMMGDLDQAMRCYEEAHEIRVNKGHVHYMDVAATRNNVGVIFMKQGRYGQAIACFSQVHNIRKQMLESNHTECSDALHNMAIVYKHQNKFKESLDHYKQALEIRRSVGSNKISVADTLYNMGVVYSKTYQYAKAVKSYKEAIGVYRQAGLTDAHVCIVNTLEWIEWGEKAMSSLTMA